MYFSAGSEAVLIAATCIHITFLNLVLWSISNCIRRKFGFPLARIDKKFSTKNSANE